jgi:hypothetical protein
MIFSSLLVKWFSQTNKEKEKRGGMGCNWPVACLGIEGKRKWEAFKLVLREIIKRNAIYYIIIAL